MQLDRCLSSVVERRIAAPTVAGSIPAGTSTVPKFFGKFSPDGQSEGSLAGLQLAPPFFLSPFFFLSYILQSYHNKGW